MRKQGSMRQTPNKSASSERLPAQVSHVNTTGEPSAPPDGKIAGKSIKLRHCYGPLSHWPALAVVSLPLAGCVVSDFRIILGNQPLRSPWEPVRRWDVVLVATLDCSSAAMFTPDSKRRRPPLPTRRCAAIVPASG